MNYYAGDATKGPYVVLGVEKQQNVAGPFRWKWFAAIARWNYVRGIPTLTDAVSGPGAK